MTVAFIMRRSPKASDRSGHLFTSPGDRARLFRIGQELNLTAVRGVPSQYQLIILFAKTTLLIYRLKGNATRQVNERDKGRVKTEGARVLRLISASLSGASSYEFVADRPQPLGRRPIHRFR